jgi:anthranilate synthase/aminodeoxychorismate synthase-like glutamine amidotransferase
MPNESAGLNDSAGFDHSPGLVQRRIDCDLDPLEVLERLGGLPGLTALVGSWAGGGALITHGPVAAATSITDIDRHPAAAAGPGDGARPGADRAALPDPAGFVGGGWFGVLGYQLGRDFETLPAPPPRPTPVPALRMSCFDHVVRYDARAGTWWFESVADPDRAGRQYRQVTARLRGPAPAPAGYRFGSFAMTPPPAAHQDAVARCLEHIAAGDIFQANICLRAEAAFTGDPLAAFVRGARALKPAYAAYVTTGHGVVASFSPELFLDRRGRAVATAPIKGTAPLSADPAALVASAKDQAENTMIVDLMRNDLSRVCLPGTVHVPAAARAEAHTGVWHLVRDISGVLRDGVADSRLVRATFPPGSITGAPKVRAMELINELETTGREAYTGAIGYAAAGRLELNVAIRTVEFLGGTAWIGVGGGIVLDSDPAKEMRECLDKLQPLLTAVGAGLDGPGLAVPALDDPARPAVPDAAGTARPAAVRRPRADLGVFETMLVTAGEVPRLAAHLERLTASVRDLYSAALPDDLEQRIRASARTCPGRGRLRVTVTPGRDQETITLTPLSSPVGPPVTLVPVQLPGGWGPRKWADRALIDHDGDGNPWPPGYDALLMDGPDLLETGRASLFLANDDGIRTPPLDGRILPGTTRRQVIDLLRQVGIPVHEHRLTLTDLSRATEAFTANAIRGIIPVAACTALPGRAWPPGPLTAWLQSRFRDMPHASPRCRPVPGTRVLLVDNYDSFVYNLARYCQELGAHTTVARNDDPALDPESIADAYDHLIISPGPGDPASAGRSIALIRQLAGALPILGVCLGHQAIAEAFGGRTIPALRPLHGRQALIRHDQRGIFTGLPPLLAAARYHSLVTDETTLPDVLVPTARTLTGLLMGVRHRYLPVHGIQVHPESILTPRGHDVLANFLAIPPRGSSSSAGNGERSAEARRAADLASHG